MDTVQLLLLFFTAFGALLAALFTWFAADATKTASRGATLLSSLERYTAIMKDKRKAQEERSPQLVAEEFYRELFDLQWSQFHLWRDSVVPDSIMQPWLRARKRNFDTDAIICRDEKGIEKRVSYKEQWEKLKSENYFEIDDRFVQFMDKAHLGTITNVKELRKLKKQFK